MLNDHKLVCFHCYNKTSKMCVSIRCVWCVSKIRVSIRRWDQRRDCACHSCTLPLVSGLCLSLMRTAVRTAGASPALATLRMSLTSAMSRLCQADWFLHCFGLVASRTSWWGTHDGESCSPHDDHDTDGKRPASQYRIQGHLSGPTHF